MSNTNYINQRLSIIHNYTVLDLGLVSTVSLGPRASTKVESHASFTESQKVSQLTFLVFVYFFFAMLNAKNLSHLT